MSLIMASLLSLFILSSFSSTKKLVAIVALVALFYVHLPAAIGLTLILAAIFFSN